MTKPARQILICKCAHAHVVPPANLNACASAARRSGMEIVEVDDLCGLAADRSPLLLSFAATSPAVIAACHPRAVEWLLRWAGWPIDANHPAIVNMRESTPQDIAAKIGVSPEETAPASCGSTPTASDTSWIPWFPVIDYSRCTGCNQCLSFCPFSVYSPGPADRRIVVTNPRNCKNECPACARICPSVAIIFPKFKDAPVNGAPILNETLEKQRAKAMADHLCKTDLRARLAERRERAAALRARRQSPSSVGSNTAD